MKTLGIILARAGSVGLRGKHLLPLMGKPVIQYTFEHARAASRLDRIFVSTDCPRITSLAQKSCIATIERPSEIAGSDASVQAAMLHAMRTVEERNGERFDALVVLYGNVPIRGQGVIDRAIELLEETGCDSVRSWCPVGKWHPAWMATLDGDRVVANQPGSVHRRQDLKPMFLHDGAVVAVSRDSMLRGEATPSDPHAFFGVDRRGFEVGQGETIEIDHQRDLYWAEAVLRERQTMRKAA